MIFPAVKNIELKIKPSHHEAFIYFIIEIFTRVNKSFVNGNSSQCTAEYIIYDFAIKQITSTHLMSWKAKQRDKFYNYKLPISIAVTVLELIQKSNTKNYYLAEFGIKLHSRCSQYIYEERLKIGEWPEQRRYA